MKHGLKGVTDATVFCKSMQKGGAKPMIRSMKSYEVGGTTGMSGMSEMSGPGDRFKRKVKKVVRRVKNAIKNAGDSGPTYRKSKCGAPGCYN
jgi:hypothetical protein